MAKRSTLKDDFRDLLNKALGAIEPVELIKQNLKVKEVSGKEHLAISSSLLFPNQFGTDTEKLDENDQLFSLHQNVYVAAFGKATMAMTRAVEDLIGDTHLVRGVAILPFAQADQRLSKHANKIAYFTAAPNNLPNMRSCEAARAVCAMCADLKPDDILLALVSGGGSALFALPVHFDGSDDDETDLRIELDVIKALVSAGANINDLNTVRSCLSMVKAGKLAEMCTQRGAIVVALAISDVIDDPLEIIASGPTCQAALESRRDGSIYRRACEIVQKYNVENKIPEKALRFLKTCRDRSIDDVTPASGDVSSNSQRVFNYLIGNNRFATDAVHAAVISRTDGDSMYDYCCVLTNSLSGEARVAGLAFAALAFVLSQSSFFHSVEPKLCRDDGVTWVHNVIEKANLKTELFPPSAYTELESQLSQLLNNFLEILFKFGNGLVADEKKSWKVCLISGGETTVNLDGIDADSRGGRNEEMTLAFELAFSKLCDAYRVGTALDGEIFFCSFGTDGIDGPTDAAGAFYSSEVGQAVDSEQRAEMTSCLARHDSYGYYNKQQRLLKIGATGTNVSDIQVLLLDFNLDSNDGHYFNRFYYK